MKKSLFLIPLLMISLMSCDPSGLLKDIDKDGPDIPGGPDIPEQPDNPKHPVDIYAKLNLKPRFNYNIHYLFTEYRDPVLIDIFLNGSSTPAEASDLFGGNISDGSSFFYYLAINAEDDFYNARGAFPSTMIDESFDVGYGLDGSSLLMMGGLILEAISEKNYFFDRMFLTLYRVDISPTNGVSFTQVSETVDVWIDGMSEEPRLDSELENDYPYVYLKADGSDNFSFIINELSLDYNPMGRENQLRLDIENIVIFDDRNADVTHKFDFKVEKLQNGDVKVTISAAGAIASNGYDLYTTPMLGDIRSTTKRFFITVTE